MQIKKRNREREKKKKRDEEKNMFYEKREYIAQYILSCRINLSTPDSLHSSSHS